MLSPRLCAVFHTRQRSCGIWVWVRPRWAKASLTALEKAENAADIRRFADILGTDRMVLFSSLLTGSFAAIADTGPAQFVRTLGNTALGVIRAHMAPAQKQNFFHQCCNRISTFQAWPDLCSDRIGVSQ